MLGSEKMLGAKLPPPGESADTDWGLRGWTSAERRGRNTVRAGVQQVRARMLVTRRPPHGKQTAVKPRPDT